MMRTRSSNSSGATYLDREARLREVKTMARRAAARIPEIRRVLLFGSLVKGIPTPRSDADLLVEIDGEIADDPRDRAGEVSRAMSPLPCPVDLFVYTSAELHELLAERAPVVTAALRDGVDLLA
jgi:predicted nucleotidyltransferase